MQKIAVLLFWGCCGAALLACQNTSPTPNPFMAAPAAGQSGATAQAGAAVGGAGTVAPATSGSGASGSDASSSGAGGAAGAMMASAECGNTICQPGEMCCNFPCGDCQAMGATCDAAVCLSGPEGLPVLCGTGTHIRCPGGGTCGDDPSDSCDPQNGGVDCAGLCQCPPAAMRACVAGFQWNPDPAVCACQPVPGPCGHTTCQRGQTCCNDSCGICALFGTTSACDTRMCNAPLTGPVACSGTGNLGCPGEGSCLDDPGDTCDPKQQGKNCSGTCQCAATTSTCAPGYVFDMSPAICACKPTM